MINEKALSKKQQRFFGIVRATQKGTFKGETTPQVQRAASSMKKKDVKKFASTKHKGLPEKKVTKESFNEDYVKELEDGLVKMDYPSYDEVDKLMCKIAKENDIDTTTLHMAFKTKHLMVPDDWAKKKMFEPVMIPKTPKDMECEENLLEYDGNYHMNKIAKERGLDLTDPRQRRKAQSRAVARGLKKSNKTNKKIDPKTGKVIKPRYDTKLKGIQIQPKKGEKKDASKTLKDYLKARKKEAETMYKLKQDAEIADKGPGDLLPDAKKIYLNKLLSNLKNKNTNK